MTILKKTARTVLHSMGGLAFLRKNAGSIHGS